MLAAGLWGRLHHSFRDRADTLLTDTIRVALGHRRLAILDLSDRGLQPMGVPDGRTWVVFNGEIYNYRELRSSLQSRGHVFRTRTDTEVVLRAYMEWGEACLAQFDGMFAFAVWDDTRARLFCARDRLGIKPFYYATPAGSFVFASEIKSLLAHPDCRREVDDVAAAGFLVHSNCDYAERTLFRGIRALPAAHSLTFEATTGRVVTRPYWNLAPVSPSDARREDRVAAVRDALVAAVRSHLISDVRIGSCLSGGLDSSTLVGIIGKLSSEDPSSVSAVGDRLYTFTSCFDDAAFDEREYALAVANSVDAQAHLVFPSPSDFWAEFERMAWHQDMPFGVLSFYAQWRVMRAARDAGVKVLIDGQGGDEVFGGYAKFRYAYLASLLRAIRPGALTRELAGMIRRRDPYFFDLRRGYRYLPHYMRRALKVDSLLQQVLKPDWRQVLADESTPATRWWRYARETTNGHGHWTPLQRIQVDDITVDTLPQLLRMEDRSSMAYSIEARVPLLDHRVVELGLSLPDDLKVHEGWSKYAVRRAMAGLLPERVRLRTTKLGFAAPDRMWLTGALRRPIAELLDSDLRCSRFVNVPSLRRWYGSRASDRANTESLLGLFRILSLEMWMRAFRLS